MTKKIKYPIQIMEVLLDVYCDWIGILQNCEPGYTIKYVRVLMNELFIVVDIDKVAENDVGWYIKEWDTSKDPPNKQKR